MTFGPSNRWYEPPEPVICCSCAEDEPDHDSEACMQEQAEAAAEYRAEFLWEERYLDGR